AAAGGGVDDDEDILDSGRRLALRPAQYQGVAPRCLDRTMRSPWPSSARRPYPALVARPSRLLPDLEPDLLLGLFHKGAKVQWTSEDLDWAPEMRLSDRQREALARLLTPVY